MAVLLDKHYLYRGLINDVKEFAWSKDSQYIKVNQGTVFDLNLNQILNQDTQIEWSNKVDKSPYQNWIEMPQQQSTKQKRQPPRTQNPARLNSSKPQPQQKEFKLTRPLSKLKISSNNFDELAKYTKTD